MSDAWPITDRYADTTSGRGDGRTVNMNAMTLEEEALAIAGTQMGWTRINMPTGATLPLPAPMIGMRGESDADDDQSFGPGATPNRLHPS